MSGIRPGMGHLIALAGLVAGLLSPFAISATAAAAGETCRGVPATIVGQPHTTVLGTAGPDVIVTNGAVGVQSLDGDDLICTTATAPQPGEPVVDALTVYAGAGRDTVDRSADADPGATARVDSVEVFVGSEAADDVSLDGAPGAVDIATAGGADLVSARGAAQTGTVDLGAGADRFVTLPSGVAGSAPPLTLAGGDGRDELSAQLAGAGSWTIDNAEGQLRGPHGAPSEFHQFEAFDVGGHGRSGVRVDFVGTAAAETVRMRTGVAGHVVLGAGADRLELSGGSPHRARLEGGAGSDLFSVSVSHQPLRLDLASAQLVTSRKVTPVRAFEDGLAFGRAQVRVLGDSGSNLLSAVGCGGARVDGRGGRDDLRFLALLDGFPTTSACDGAVRFTAHGGAGDDHLVGGPAGDLLDGGPGHDRADGGAGRDTCVAVESAVSC